MRTSNVDLLHIDTVSYSSIVELGDSSIIQGFSRALATQKEQELFFGNERDFSSYSIFTEQLPFNPIFQKPSVHIDNRASPMIKVKNIKVTGVSSTSILHIGNSKMIQMETRIKHIRHLMDEKTTDPLEK